jgi:signal transduction histidine kinase
MLIISIVGTIIILVFNVFLGIVTMITCILLIYFCIFYTKKRYEEIKKLSEYLRTISSGDFSMDIRDNVEGELSILKNEIYKVTLILSKYGEYEKREKKLLADSLSDISHQLKTPLTSMMVMTDLLSNENLEAEKRMEFTKIIQAQLDRMEWLLTSLLKLSKIDAGTISFKREMVNVSELIKKAINALLIPLELKEQNLIIEGDSDVAFTGDFNWTAEAIINIVKNCIEHTNRTGSITISYEENPLYTEIKISDNGNGIDKEDLPYIFKRFYKGKNASSDSVGIGLAMAKSIVESQNGDLTVKSKKNEGTQFSIKFYKQIV